MRIAAFGFRSIPPKEGSAGEDKFAIELYTRLAKEGHEVTAYNRYYSKNSKLINNYLGIKIVNLKTTKISGFDTLLHSFKATLHIIINNSADIVHIQNGGNSMWAIILRVFGKKIFLSQDGIDWNREKWRWYAKAFLFLSSYIAAKVPNQVIFDNIFAKELYENKFKKAFHFIPYGCEVEVDENRSNILEELKIKPNEYFLFIGRFIPDKGIHYLIEAYTQLNLGKKLILVGGSPNPSDYEKRIRSTVNKNIFLPGFIYGNDTNVLIKNAYCYIQPSDVEGLSPLILTVMGLGTPLLCSNIKENLYIVEDCATTFERGNVENLKTKLEYVLNNQKLIKELSNKGKEIIQNKYKWDSIVEKYISLFESV